MVIDQENSRLIKATFKEVYTNKDEITRLNEINSDLIKALYDRLGIDRKNKKAKAAIKSAYKYWVKNQSNDSELDEMIDILEAISE